MVCLGIKPDEAHKTILEEGEIAEGYHTLGLVFEWVKSLSENLLNELPLLNCLYDIIFKHYEPEMKLRDLVKTFGE